MKRARDRLLLALVLGLVAPPAGVAFTAGSALWLGFAVTGPLVGLTRLGIAGDLVSAGWHDVVLALAAGSWLVAVFLGAFRAMRLPTCSPSRAVGVGVGYVVVTQGLVATSAFFLERVDVEGVSMEPSFRPGEDVLVALGTPEPGTTRVGDVVLYPGPLGQEPWIKRVIARGGQVVSSGPDGLLVDGVPMGTPATMQIIARDKGCTSTLEVPLLTETQGERSWYVVVPHLGPETPLTVPPGHVYLLGDNRPSSYDSRRHGPVPEAALLGVARGIANGRSACGWDLSRWGARP
jgi:signal peptidase I